MMSSDMSSACGFKSWDLTPYEQQRKPHELLRDGELCISPKLLQSELTCPICLDLLRNTRTTKECLHLFCCDCIETALRSGNKECPTCRKKLISKRCLRRDPNFNALINKLFPSQNDLDEFHEKVLATKSKLKSLSSKIASSSVDDVTNEDSKMKRHSQLTMTNVSTSKGQDSDNDVMNKKTKSRRCTSIDDEQNNKKKSSDIEIFLKPHPVEHIHQTQNQRTIITSTDATMNHLSKYLNLRIKIEKDCLPTSTHINARVHNRNEDDFIFYVQQKITVTTLSSNSFVQIKNSTTLDKMIDTSWKHIDKPWNIYYKTVDK
ncbi:unnamed protein product [Didymodactylos carnosus]|uniref:RING-type E3 ubiquitin transferase n=1 Tax=Didymodactylos carnosus TaxID=1234261 RepID=A0A8S2CT38_9BILA|nr:unnamed protein product [Didymodactylos carnosus]CAF3511677.1 unnamed protein product [Didymodactylos carnosus]